MENKGSRGKAGDSTIEVNKEDIEKDSGVIKTDKSKGVRKASYGETETRT